MHVCFPQCMCDMNLGLINISCVKSHTYTNTFFDSLVLGGSSSNFVVRLC